jgi:hypothetical protein
LVAFDHDSSRLGFSGPDVANPIIEHKLIKPDSRMVTYQAFAMEARKRRFFYSSIPRLM